MGGSTRTPLQVSAVAVVVMLASTLTAFASVFGLFFFILIRIKGLEHVIIHYRWVFVCLCLLPASALYDLIFYLRNGFIFYSKSAPKQHDARVEEIQQQVRNWHTGGRLRRMCTARPGWLTISFRTPLYKQSLNAIRINLMDILEVNTEKRTVYAEPLVTMGQLTATLNPLGYTLPVIPELDDLTLGGLIMGVGIETSSHIYGLFQETVVSVEMVLQDGSRVRCSKDENSELFMAVPWSHGSLGFLVAAEIRIIPARRYVKLEYFPAYSAAEFTDLFAEKSLERDKNHFVEGILYTKDSGVVMTGSMTDSAESGKENSIGHYWKPWFYKHVESFLKKRITGIEYIPLRHYYHRHTKSIFWMLHNIIPFGNHPAFRYLLGWMVPPKVSFLKLTQGETIRRLYEERQMIQDMLVPLAHLRKSIDYFDKEIDLYPLWFCPFWLPSRPGFLHPASMEGDGEMYVDIGAYGEPLSPNFKFRASTRKLETFVRENNGFQMLYADSYMTAEEFRGMFDHTLYDKMRRDLDCVKAFPDIYEKTNRNARY
ncbi:Delta(24)-sterol reductase [Hypsibius exemplaris]|uniref:Delta(24)-sterol reductase n=1 Tax=Hypsibius exemplaris TaxID=2072580 RepID=A0A1W0X884_HYPEX|nr:Delta(24)-sterol reductase [Hypsibius exemplaris]